MMSLTETNLWAVVKKQYTLKLQSYSTLFVSLAVLQMIALLFTLGGMVGSMSTGSTHFNIMVRYYSGSGLLAFTFIWALITGFILALPGYRDIDFTFVGNRLSSNLSNICFLVTGSAAGGISATLGSLLLRNLVFYTAAGENMLGADYFVSPRELLIGAAAAVLYLLLLSAAGYLSGVLIHLHRALVLLLPALIVGTFILEARNENVKIIIRAIDFFARESSLGLFALKVFITVLLLWGCAVLLSNHKEARV